MKHNPSQDKIYGDEDQNSVMSLIDDGAHEFEEEHELTPEERKNLDRLKQQLKSLKNRGER